jgi:hypothetical protein
MGNGREGGLPGAARGWGGTRALTRTKCRAPGSASPAGGAGGAGGGLAERLRAQIEAQMRRAFWDSLEARAPPPPLRTKWTRLVHPSVLIGHERTRPARPALCGATAAAPSGWNAGAQKWPGKVAGRLPRRRPVSEPPPLPRRRPRSRATRPTSTGWYGSSRRCAPLSPPAATRLSKRDSILERAQLVRLGGTRRVRLVREKGRDASSQYGR